MSFYQTAIKKISGRSTAFVTAAAFAAICSSHTMKENANFSGDWTLNEQKSDLGQFGGRVAPKQLKVTQSADALTTDKTSSFNGEERKTTEKLTFDGKESESAGFGNSKKKSTAKWGADGQSIIVSSTTVIDRNGETMEIKGTETWKLLDPKTLSIETASSSSRGTFNVKAVYEKK